ncbi:hypothetical protein JCM11491_004790 [Sporobolomyces phaffii]
MTGSDPPLASDGASERHSADAVRHLAGLGISNDDAPDRPDPERRPSHDRTPHPTPPRTHRDKSYFPLVASPPPETQTSPRSPPTSRDVTPTAEVPPAVPSTSRTSIFPVVQPPAARPTPSSVFPLVKSPSANSTRKMSANPFPFAEPPPPLSPVSASTGRRPSLAPSTTSSTSDTTSTSGSASRPRTSTSAPSSSIPRSPSATTTLSSTATGTGSGRLERAPSVTSTNRSPSRMTTYAPSIAPSAEGPTSIFATPVGYKPARSLAGLVFSKPSVILNGGNAGGGGGRGGAKTSSTTTDGSGGMTRTTKKKFGSGLFSSARERERRELERGITAPAHLVAGPERSRSSRVLDAALTTSQTWAIRRGEQLMSPTTATSGSFASPNPAASSAFAYRPGHQVRRELERDARAVAPDELSRRLEVERDAAIFSNGGAAETFPTVARKGEP